MPLLEMTWIGGPSDGDVLLVQDRSKEGPITVITGSKRYPETRSIRPRQRDDGTWILPFYEGQIVTGDQG